MNPKPVPPRSGAYKWWVVFMLWFICFFNYADRQSITSVFPMLEKEFGFDKKQIGYIGAAFMWVYAGAAPLAGFIGDRVRRKDLILGGCFAWSLVTMATGWCGKYWHFVTVRALEGFGETFYFPASMSLLSDYHSPKTRSRAMSFHQSSVYIGTIAGSWAGGWFAERMGWRNGFYVFGAAGIVLSLVLLRFLHEPRRGASGESVASTLPEEKPAGIAETLRMILVNPTALLLMAAFVGANFVATIFLAWTPTFLFDKFHFKPAAAGLTGTVYIQLASAVSVPIAGMLADKLSQRLAGGRMLVQAFGLLAGSTFVFLVGHTVEMKTLLVSMTLFGFCKGFYDSNIFASLYDVVPARARSTAAGIMNTVGWTGGALGPIFVGNFTMRAGGASQVENMSVAISFGGAVYVAAAAVLLLAAFSARNRRALAM